MFIRASHSGSHTYLRLVKSYRDEQGHTRHQQIAQLGRIDRLTDREVEGLLASLQLSELWNEMGLGKALRGALHAA